MKVIKNHRIDDGFSIQLEDWHEDFPSFPATIAVYPKDGWRTHFRAQVDFPTLDEAASAFEKLCSGDAKVFDFCFTVMQKGGIRVPMMQVLKRDD